MFTKMKKSFIYLLAIAFTLSFMSCGEEIIRTLQDEYVSLSSDNTTLRFLRVGDGQAVDAGIQAVLIAAQKSSPVSVSFEIDGESTAVEGTHYTVEGNSVTIDANQSFGTLPIKILPDNIEPGEQWTIKVNLTSSDLNLTSNEVTYAVEVTCPSELAGTYTSTTTGQSTDGCCPDVTTVEGEVTLTEVGDGVYTISDWSAGLYFTWYEVYGVTAAYVSEGNLNTDLLDVCTNISATFTEPFQTETVISGSVSNGVITYTWTNGYDDTAEVVLTPQ